MKRTANKKSPPISGSILTAFFLLVFAICEAQSCYNMNFETGTLSGWTIAGNVTVVSAGNDMYGNFPVSAPGGSFSVKVGNDNDPSPSTISRSFLVTSSNSALTYRYAMDLLNYPHTSIDAGRIVFDIFDANNNPISSAHYEAYYANGGGTPGFLNSNYPAGSNLNNECCYNVSYKPWTSVNVNLCSYIGQTVTLKASCEWCFYDVDWAYAYFDFDCLNIAPNANAGPDKTLTCVATTTTLNASPVNAGESFSWAGPGIVSGGTTLSPTVNAVGTYTLTVTNSNGCTTSDVVVVNKNITPPNANAGPDKSLTCVVHSLNLFGSSSAAGATFNWGGAGIVSGSNTATPTINATGTYTLTVTNPANGCTSIDVVVVNQDITPADADAGLDKTLTCFTPSLPLNGSSTSAGASYSWSGPGIVSGGSTATPTVNVPGTYTLTVTRSNGCTATDVVVVSQNITPADANAGVDQTLTCVVQSVTLTGSTTTAGASYTWAGAGVVSGGTTLTPTVNASGTYTLTVTNPVSGCTATDIVVVYKNVLPPNVNAGPNKSLTCVELSLNLAGSSTTAGATFGWSGAGITSDGTTLTPTVNATGSYTLTATNPANGCTATDVVVVNQNITAPNVNAGPDKTLTCVVHSLTLSGSSTASGATYSWAGPGIVSGGTTATPTVNATGTYTLTVTKPSNGCTSIDSVVVTQNITAPNANAGADKTISCAAHNLILSGSSTTTGAKYSWAGPGIVSGATTASPTVNAAGTYVLTVKDPVNGCTSTDTVVVNQLLGKPNVDAGSAQALTCIVTSLTLNGSSSTAGATFSWTGTGIVSGAATATPTVNAAGTYILTVTDPANGCKAMDTVVVNNNAMHPNANAGADKSLTCLVNTLTLAGSSTTAGTTFKWTGPGIVSGDTTATPTVNAVGTYTLTITDPVTGCTSTDQSVVNLNTTAPNVSAGADKIQTCAVTSLSLNGSSTTAGAIFSWLGAGIVSGGSTATPTINAAGTYTLTVTNPINGCTSTDNVQVNQNTTSPNVNAGADQVITCLLTSISLNGTSGTAGATYSWSGPGIVSGGTTATPTVNATGTYTLTVKDPVNGCTSMDSVVVSQSAGGPNVDAGLDKSLTCVVHSLTLAGSSTTVSATFSWSGTGIVSGATTATPTINAAGTYTLTVTDPGNGCKSTDIVVVNNDITAPNVNAGADKTLTCVVHTVTLAGSSTTTGASFKWTGAGIITSDTTATPTVNAAGTYTLTVTNPINGCVSTDQVLVTKDTLLPTANVAVDQPLNCVVHSVTLSGVSTTAGAIYSWAGAGILSGAGDSTAKANLAGTYTLTVSNPINGCTSTAQVIVVTDTASPNANAGADQTLNCIVTSVTLNGSSTTAGHFGLSYQWSGAGIVSGDSTATATVNMPGAYVLIITDGLNGCKSSDTVVVTNSITVPDANAGSDQTLTCATTSLQLNGSSTTAGATFSWAGAGIVSGATTATPTINATGTYTLTVTDPGNGCKSTDTVVVNKNVTAPDANAGADKTLTCVITSLQLNGFSATAGATYSWAGGGIVSGGTIATPIVDHAGNYVLTVTDPVNGCTAMDSMLVTNNTQLPNVNAGLDKILTCKVPSLILNGSSTSTDIAYSWSGAGIVSGGFTAKPTINAAGTYVVTVVDSINGCIASDTTIVYPPQGLPSISAGNDQILTCSHPSVILNGSSSKTGVIYLWTGPGINSNGADPMQTVSLPGNHILTVTDTASGCSVTDTAVVLINTTAPNANAGTGQTLTCTASTVTLTGSSTSSGIVYSWSGAGIVSGASTATPVVNVAGTYTLTVTNTDNGCASTVDIAVGSDTVLPTVNAGMDQTITCSSSIVTLSASSTTAGISYSWVGAGVTGSTTDSTVTANLAGTYTLTVTNPINGCTATDVVVVNQNIIAPGVNAGTDKTLTCVFPSLILDGSSTATGVTYNWTGPGIVAGGNTLTPTVNVPGNYVLTITDSINGCAASDQVVVVPAFGLPIANAGTDQTITCTIASLQLSGSSASTGVTFSWAGPGIVSGGSSTTPTVNAAGTYTLTVTDPSNGCTANDQVVVNLNTTLPDVNAGIDQTITCSTPVLILNGSSTTTGVSFNWTGPGVVSGGTTATVTVNIVGTYTLTVTNPANGCINSDLVVITANTPALGLNATGNDTICLGEQVSLTAQAFGGNGGPYTYSWLPATGLNSTSIANPTASPGVTTTYTVTVSDNCTTPLAVKNITITVLALPVIQFSVTDTAGCAPFCVSFTDRSASQGGIATWNWNFGSDGNSTTANPTHCFNNPGVYDIALTVTTTAGCSQTYSHPAMIKINGLPTADFTYDPEVITIENPDVQFTNTSTHATKWHWNFGDPNSLNDTSSLENPMHSYKDTGTYCIHLTVENAGGCTDSITYCLTIASGYTFYIPNAFSPNDDDINDDFFGKGTGIKDYQLFIFDRWGNEIFFSDRMEKHWDGKANHGENTAQRDVYVYRVLINDVFQRKHVYTGIVTIVL